MTDLQTLPAPEETGLALVRRWWGDHPIAQAVGLLVAAVLLGIAASNILESMHRLGMAPSLDYLRQPASFDISESLIAYRAGDPYYRAILVGILNTLKLAASGCVIATALGLFLGLVRVAGNPLVSRLVEAYVELVRNTPLVLQLFFWIALTHALPPVRQAIQPLPGTFLSVRGVYVPWIAVEHGSLWPLAVLLAVIAVVVSIAHKRLGRALSAAEWLLIAFAAVGVSAAWVWGGGVSISLDTPTLKGFNIVGGLALTPEFAAMVAGLSVYYAANVSEIVRSGLQSVARGQWEAGRALGFSRGRILHLIVLPQAMRVITPLMTSTYLDLTKDTTLGVLIGFTEVTAIIKTSANNTGNAVETILVLLVVFLSISLPISAAINAYNRALARRGLVAT
ncbi:MAG: ABC transporter permease subunit [Hyphomicrobiales bacterium]|nr:ABC transporter permease subunit [Hyphomicrobiales bacterium]